MNADDIKAELTAKGAESLPQEAAERGMSAEEYLLQCCLATVYFAAKRVEALTQQAAERGMSFEEYFIRAAVHGVVDFEECPPK